jgi:AGZA family xanthine/uracil permease-like MFS transporter
MDERKVGWWVAGDWDAFFGLGTNSVLNILVLSGLLLFLIEILPLRRSTARLHCP